MKPLVFEGTPLIYPRKMELLTKEAALAGLNEMICAWVEMFDGAVCGDFDGGDMLR